MLPLTVPEVRRLLVFLAEPPDRFRFRLSWSRWRRRHQAVAQRCHIARRARRQSNDTGGADPAGTGQHDPVGRNDREEITAEEWERLEPLLTRRSRVGRPSTHDPRQLIAAILWVQRGGRTWRELPARFGKWLSVYAQYRRWRQSGLWQRITRELSTLPTTTEVSL